MSRITELRVTFDNGEVWSIDPLVIAENRADYYACKVDGHPRGGVDWREEVDAALENAYDLGDWARNNMNWSDVRPYAKQIETSPVDYEHEWVNAEFTCVRGAKP